jgi:integrase
MALRWRDVDLEAGTINVRESYDPRTKTFGPPKSKKGKRQLWMPELLVPFLKQLARDWKGDWAKELQQDALVFGRPDGTPFADSSVADRVVPRWQALGLKPIGLHEARHTYASLMIAANVNIKTISEFMGHSSVTITLDRYGHLLPSAGPEAAALFNAYLEEYRVAA